MVTNPEFREQMFGLYNTVIQPQLGRFDAYDSELEKLTSMFMYSLSRDDLAEFTEAYRGFKQTDDERKEDYLSLLHSLTLNAVISSDTSMSSSGSIRI